MTVGSERIVEPWKNCRIRKKKNGADPCTKRFENLYCWKENPVGLFEKLFADLNILSLCGIFRSGKIDADPDLRILGQEKNWDWDGNRGPNQGSADPKSGSKSDLDPHLRKVLDPHKKSTDPRMLGTVRTYLIGPRHQGAAGLFVIWNKEYLIM